MKINENMNSLLLGGRGLVKGLIANFERQHRAETIMGTEFVPDLEARLFRPSHDVTPPDYVSNEGITEEYADGLTVEASVNSDLHIVHDGNLDQKPEGLMAKVRKLSRKVGITNNYGELNGREIAAAATLVVGAIGGAAAMSSPVSSQNNFHHISLNPQNSNQQVGTVEVSSGQPSAFDWYKSSDGGQSWTQGAEPNGFNPTAIEYLRDGSAMVATVVKNGSGSGIFRSTDGGSTWEATTDPDGGTDWFNFQEFDGHFISFSPNYADKNHIVSHGRGGRFIESNDAGQSWQLANHKYLDRGWNNPAINMSFNAAGDNWYILVKNVGIVDKDGNRITDNAATAAEIPAMLVDWDASPPVIVYTPGQNGAATYRTTNNGSTWQTKILGDNTDGSGNPQSAAVGHWGIQNGVYVGVSDRGNIYTSVDDGVTFLITKIADRHGFYLGNAKVLCADDNPNRYFVMMKADAAGNTSFLGESKDLQNIGAPSDWEGVLFDPYGVAIDGGGLFSRSAGKIVAPSEVGDQYASKQALNDFDIQNIRVRDPETDLEALSIVRYAFVEDIPQGTQDQSGFMSIFENENPSIFHVVAPGEGAEIQFNLEGNYQDVILGRFDDRYDRWEKVPATFYPDRNLVRTSEPVTYLRSADAVFAVGLLQGIPDTPVDPVIPAIPTTIPDSDLYLFVGHPKTFDVTQNDVSPDGADLQIGFIPHEGMPEYSEGFPFSPSEDRATIVYDGREVSHLEEGGRVVFQYGANNGVNEGDPADVSIRILNYDIADKLANLDSNSRTIGFSHFLEFAQAFGTSSDDPGYNANADANGDGTVDFTDFLMFAEYFNVTAPDDNTGSTKIAQTPFLLKVAQNFHDPVIADVMVKQYERAQEIKEAKGLYKK